MKEIEEILYDLFTCSPLYYRGTDVQQKIEEITSLLEKRMDEKIEELRQEIREIKLDDSYD